MLNRRLRTRANLIDMYWSTLRHQRPPEPPADLDDETAQLIAQLERYTAPADASAAFVDQLWAWLEAAPSTDATTSRAWAGPALDPTRQRRTSSRPSDTTEEQHDMSNMTTRPEPLPLQQRRRSRELLTIAAAALAFLLVGALLVLALRDDGDDEPSVGPSGPTPTPTSLATATTAAVASTTAAQPTATTTAAVTATPAVSPTPSLPTFGTLGPTIQLGDSPRQVAVGHGSLWVTNAEDGTISRIDLATDQVIATIVVVPPEDFITGVDRAVQVDAIAVGDDVVWVSADNSSQLVRVDPATNAVVERVSSSFGIHELLFADGALWGRSWTGNHIVRLDPATDAVLASIPVEMPAAFVYLNDALWVRRPGEVLKIDPATNSIVETVTFADTPGDISAPRRGMIAAGGSLWVTSDSWHELLQIDSVTASVVGPVPLPFTIDIVNITGDDDTLWACPCLGIQLDEVWQLDLATLEWTARQPVPFVVGVVALDDSLWAFTAPRGDLARINLTP